MYNIYMRFNLFKTFTILLHSNIKIIYLPVTFSVCNSCMWLMTHKLTNVNYEELPQGNKDNLGLRFLLIKRAVALQCPKFQNSDFIFTGSSIKPVHRDLKSHTHTSSKYLLKNWNS